MPVRCKAGGSKLEGCRHIHGAAAGSVSTTDRNGNLSANTKVLISSVATQETPSPRPLPSSSSGENVSGMELKTCGTEGGKIEFTAGSET